MLGLLVAGGLVLVWFFLWVRAKERKGKEPLLPTSLFRSRTSNLGLITQNTQWLILMGISFTVAAYLQVVRGYDAIETGVIFTAATVGLLLTSLGAERFAKRRAQRSLIMAGFVLTIVGIGVFLAMVSSSPSVWAFAPGLFLIGLGIGLMLTPSVNVVRVLLRRGSAGEISGLSRSVSNLGSSLGTAIAGTILVAGIAATPERAYGLALAVLAGIGVVGLVAAAFLPRDLTQAATDTDADTAPTTATAPAPRKADDGDVSPSRLTGGVSPFPSGVLPRRLLARVRLPGAGEHDDAGGREHRGGHPDRGVPEVQRLPEQQPRGWHRGQRVDQDQGRQRPGEGPARVGLLAAEDRYDRDDHRPHTVAPARTRAQPPASRLRMPTEMSTAAIPAAMPAAAPHPTAPCGPCPSRVAPRPGRPSSPRPGSQRWTAAVGQRRQVCGEEEDRQPARGERDTHRVPAGGAPAGCERHGGPVRRPA